MVGTSLGALESKSGSAESHLLNQRSFQIIEKEIYHHIALEIFEIKALKHKRILLSTLLSI
jgi:hypothetical protein